VLTETPNAHTLHFAKKVFVEATYKYILPISVRNAAGMHITFSQFNLVSAS